MKRFERYTIPLGMVGAVAYLIHTIFGRILWQDYNPVTTDISSLTSVGTPNRTLLMVFTTIYGIATILFVLGMVKIAFQEYLWGVRTG